MNIKLIILFLSLSSLITYGVGQTIGVDRHGNSSQTEGFFINQFGEECNRPRLNCYGQILGYPPIVSTDSGSLHSTDHLDMFGTVLFNGWGTVTSRGFQYSNYENFANATIVAAGNGLGTFQGSITSLSPNQTYYYRGFADNQYGRGYGNTLDIHTEIGKLVLGEVTNGFFSNSFNIRIPIQDNGGGAVRGTVCAYTDPDRTQLFSCCEISPTMAPSVTTSFHNIIPGTDYYVEGIITNTRDTSTFHMRIHIPTDLSVRVYQGTPAESYGCDPPSGKDYHFYLSISGKDPRKEQAEILWNYSGGTATTYDTNLVVHAEEVFTLSVTASIVVGEDTIVAANTLTLQTSGAIRTPATCSCCNEEFINTVSCSGNAIAYNWVNEHNDTIANTASATLPTGEYILWYTDNYGCSFGKPMHVGPKVRHCFIEGEPRSSESAHLENGVWVLDSIQDHQGNWYIIKQYGSQCWMRQSMRCTNTPSGTELMIIGENRIRARYFDDVYDPEKTKQWGLRYTWLAATDTDYYTLYPANLSENWRGICPDGWHIPSWEECITLAVYVIHEKDSTLVISPAPNPSNTLIGSNISIGNWLTHSCSYYAPESDWAEFSLMKDGNISSMPNGFDIFVTDNYGNNMAQSFYVKRNQNGFNLKSYGYNTALPVKCIRNP